MTSIAILLAIAWVSAATAQDKPSSVRWDTIQVTGNHAFSEARIKSELFAQPEFLIANHPYDDRRNVPQVACELLVKGYRNEGFPDATVQWKQIVADADEPILKQLIEIDEGTRIMRGPVRVVGADRIDVELLLERLTMPYPDRDAIATFVYSGEEIITQWVDKKGQKSDFEKPIWSAQKGVPFDGETSMHQRVSDAFADLGFSSAIVLVRLEVDADNASGTLIIDVVEEGERDRIEKINVAGLSNNHRDQFLQYIATAEGDEIDREKVQEIGRLLWESGRFKTQNVQVDSQTKTLKIEVEELSGLPRLDQPISENGRVLLKANAWLAGLGLRGDDVLNESEFNDSKVFSAFSKHGVLLKITHPQASGKTSDLETLSVLVDSEQLLIDHSRINEKLTVPVNRIAGRISFWHRYSAATDAAGFLKAQLGFYGSSSIEPGQSPMQADFLSSPADWLPMAYKSSVKLQQSDGELILIHEQERIRIDVQSGKINEWVTPLGTIRFAPGIFDAARDAVVHSVATKPTVDVADQLITKTMQYMLAEPVVDTVVRVSRSPDGDPILPLNTDLVAAIRKLVEGGLLSLLDSVHQTIGNRDTSETFNIPSKIKKTPSTNQMIAEVVARAALMHAHQFFEEDTWPLMLTREGSLMLLGATQHTGKVMGSLIADDQTGPIGLAAIRLFLQYANVDEKTLAAISAQALQRLNPPQFAADVEQLTRVIPTDVFRGFRQSLTSLSEAELDAVVTLSENESWQQGVRRIHQVGKEFGDKTREAEFWYLVLHGPLETWLKGQ